MNTQDIVQKLRRLHTLLVLGKRSNNLALAIRRALDAINTWPEDARVMVQKTPIRILFAGYGPKFIKLFEELLRTGDIQLIHQLQPEFDPFFCYLCEIPGIGETMARRMYFDRSIRSMDDLRIAYSNNILQRIPSFGDIRLKAIEDVLWISQTRDMSPPDVPQTFASSQLALPSVYTQPKASGGHSQQSVKFETPSGTEYTQSYGQSYDAFSDIDADNEEDDLFSSVYHPASMPASSSANESCLKNEQPVKGGTSLSHAMRQTEFRSLPGLIPSDDAEQISGSASTYAESPSLPVFNAVPAASLAGLSAGGNDMRQTASPSAVHQAVSRTIQAQGGQPEDAAVKAQLEAFIKRDLQAHGIIGQSTQETEVSNIEHIYGNDNAQRMAGSACHSGAQASYEADGRKDVASENHSSGTVICVENLQSTEIIVAELVATLLKTDVLIAENIQIDRRMPELSEDAQMAMHADRITADTIYADSVTAQIVRAKTVRVRYLVSQVIRG